MPKDHSQHPIAVRPGRGPHKGELYCIKCHKHIKWLSQQHYKDLKRK